MNKPLRSATSPDGLITLELYESDFIVGFKDQAWHTHGDLLVPEYGASPREAALAFFDSVVGDQEVICVSREQGKDIRLSITHDPDAEAKYVQPGEQFQMRLWSGKEVAA